jgi:hypothetical protein
MKRFKKRGSKGITTRNRDKKDGKDFGTNRQLEKLSIRMNLEEIFGLVKTDFHVRLEVKDILCDLSLSTSLLNLMLNI